MRGKLHGELELECRRRIIPAHAGQTPPDSPPVVSHPDHPRACGANLSQIGMHSRPAGSSPRMRGKRLGELAYCGWCRIIPAHAGQTLTSGEQNNTNSDHPRACGANALRPCRLHARCGSSPRMRGKQRYRRQLPRVGRIIPAHAGQTHTLKRYRKQPQDHPRACGAN